MGYKYSIKSLKLEELKQVTKDVVNYLRKKGHPHMAVIITERSVKITEDIMGTPLDYDD